MSRVGLLLPCFGENRNPFQALANTLLQGRYVDWSFLRCEKQAESTYNLLRKRSHEIGRAPDELADKVLREHLAPPHPHIEIVSTRSGLKAMIKGTRVAVSTVIGYIQLSETPDSIAQNVLPHLALAQIYAAISYYYDHQDEIETELTYNTEAASQERLRARLGEDDFCRLTGQAASS